MARVTPTIFHRRELDLGTASASSFLRSGVSAGNEHPPVRIFFLHPCPDPNVPDAVWLTPRHSRPPIEQMEQDRESYRG
jgi:hypothetical protein